MCERFPVNELSERRGDIEALGKEVGVSRELIQEGSRGLAAESQYSMDPRFLPVADQPHWDILSLGCAVLNIYPPSWMFITTILPSRTGRSFSESPNQ